MLYPWERDKDYDSTEKHASGHTATLGSLRT